MITMIFEKTLNRKIIGSPKKAETEEHVNGVIDTQPNPDKSLHRLRNIILNIGEQVKRLVSFRAQSKDIKEPASMGKILNLMR